MPEVTAKQNLLCPLRYALGIIGGKWKLPILCLLAEGQPLRYGAIKRKTPSITNMMLSQSLKELEESKIVHREQYNEIPPKVEYTLTEQGRSLLPLLECLAGWSSEQMKKAGSQSNVCEICKSGL